jgi:hypothetical protein
MTIHDEVMTKQQNVFRAALRTSLQTAALAMAAMGVALSASAQSLAVAPAQENSMLAVAESPSAFATIAGGEGLALPTVGVSSSAATSSAALPDAPSAVMFASSSEPMADTMDKRPVDSSPTAPYASRFTKYIPANQRGMKISGGDKIVLGLKDVVSPFSFIGIVFTAGYSQVTNGEPNYGTDKGAFGERLWATAVRDSTEGFFTDSVMSPILHEDPRYYVEGDQFSFVHRTLYAVTRPLITRTDSGHASVNGALLIGYVFASALSYAYYPKNNQTFHDTASTYGGSIGGAALGDFVSEFADGFLQAIHLEKKQ